MSSPMNGMLYAHKGIRAELASMEDRAGSLVAGEAWSAVQMADRLSFFRRVVKRHNDAEEEVLWPVLEEKFPQISVPYTLDHRADEETFDAIEALLAEFQRVSGQEGAQVARKLSREVVVLRARLWQHSRKEDTHLVPLTQELLDIPTQGRLAGRMAGYISPELLPQAIPMVFQAIDLDERVDYLGKMKPAMPPEQFMVMVGWVRDALPPGEWADLCARMPDLAPNG